ncbi:MAG: TonB-dependent receptor [Ferruginibacter sp.]|nr:TonB-dependent receptor [Ferruginibacter sp.]
MKHILLLVSALIFQYSVNAQKKLPNSDSAGVALNLEEIVISANNFTEKKKNVAQKIDVLSARDIAASNAQNTGDLLSNTGKIFVQKSQQGGSSPVIRGFEASRILLVIDGVRMNNAIYRGGHLQNAITVDQNSLARVEIMYGPASTIYGSDALGGIIHLVTKSPILSGDQSFLSTGSAFTRFSSANNEKTIHADMSIGGKKIAWLQAYNFSDFGDLKMGNRYPTAYPDFGRRTQYVESMNGVDSIVNNPDDRVQKFSGYRQWDILQKLVYKPTERLSHSLNFQFSNSGDVPRYDRLQDVRNGALRYASWYYGPQKRFLGAYELSATNLSFWNELKLNVNYQDIEESRYTRDYRRYDRFDSRIERVKVFGAGLTGRKIIGAHEITAGADLQLNDVKSRANRKNLLTGEVSKLDTRYPDGKNKMNNFGVFVQHVFKFQNEKFVLNDGLRVQHVSLNSSISDNSFFKLPDTIAKQRNTAITGNVGLVFKPQDNTNIKVSYSAGFRAPNIDDLAKIFESSTAARQVVVPNAKLRPEYTHNFDLSIYHKIASRVAVQATGFYTFFTNAIIKAPFILNGQDSILYNGVKSQVLASQNVNRASLYGFSGGLDVDFSAHFTFTSTISYTKGNFKVPPGKISTIYEQQPAGNYLLVQRDVRSRPLDHIPPLMGRSAISFKNQLITTEFYVLFNGWKHLDNYNPDGEDNAQYATADGMPSWVTLNWKGSMKIGNNLHLQLGVENIADRNYRYFASGFSAPGRNFIVGLRGNW